MKQRKKNLAAITLGLRGVRARMKLPREERSEQARNAVLARWAKARGGEKPAKPARWWCLFDIQDPDQPQVLFSSPDKAEVVSRSLGPEFRERFVHIGFLEYDPSVIVFENEFRPDPTAQTKALKALLDSPLATEGDRS